MAEAYEKRVDEYKERVKKEAENLVKVTFPKKVCELNDLLESDKFNVSRTSRMPEDLNIPVPDAILVNNHDSEVTGKKRKIDGISKDVEFAPGSKVLLLPNGAVNSNSQILELIDIVKPYIVDLVDHANKLKMWITYLIPKIEDGNNFGVSIQEDTMAEARQVETEAASLLDQISRYYMTRGKIISKVAKYPHVTDFRRTVSELDEKEFISLRLCVCELRNHYASLHDLIIKNFDKIKKPRSVNTDNMY